VKQLSARETAAPDRQIPIKRLEKYSRLENDILKTGEDIKSLARFTSTQRTAIRKLLKKYKKWTGSANLENRFREEVLDDPKSFTKLDLGSLLDDYSDTLLSIRSLYERRLNQSAPFASLAQPAMLTHQPAVERISSVLTSKSKVAFDNAIATVPVGKQGSLAYYFVHSDNVVELQVLLLQHLRYYTPRSRTNSAVPSEPGSTDGIAKRDQDYFSVVADDADRLARIESAITVDEREDTPGRSPQKAKVSIRWNMDEDAIVSVRDGSSNIKSASLKRKSIDASLTKDGNVSGRKDSVVASGDSDLQVLRDEISEDSSVRRLYQISSCRSRFVGLNTGSLSSILATLDTNISLRKADGKSESAFPFAVLHVRKDGPVGGELLALLNHSHLVERVRGFSLHYQALWQFYEPANVAPPFWVPILSRDIRKLPPPASKATDGSMGASSGSQSATLRSASTNDGTTAVDSGGQSSSAVPDQLQTPPLRAFRKKRRRTYAEQQREVQQRYWSEYDHPEEDDQNASEAYVLYFDPNEKSTFDRIVERFGTLFKPRRPEEQQPLLTSTPEEDELSSDDEAIQPKATAYGAIHQRTVSLNRSTTGLPYNEEPSFLPQVTSVCFVASITTLILAYILSTTSKHKFVTEVDTAILFAVGCSLTFAVVGCVPLLQRSEGNWLVIVSAATLVTLVAVFSGGLVASILG